MKRGISKYERTARERPCLHLRREVALRIMDKNAVTKGEIHRVCAEAVGIDEH